MIRQRKIGGLSAAALAAVAILMAACGDATSRDEAGEAATAETAGVTPAGTAELGRTSSRDEEGSSVARDSQAVDPLFAPYDKTKMAPMSGQLAEDFQSIRELALASPVIVAGNVLGIEYAPYQNIPFTIVTLRVEHSIKGDVAEGDQVRIVETGGVFAGRSKEETGEFGQPVEAAFEGVPVMKTGERWLLFLGAYDPGPVATGAYSVKGVFQGKLRIAEDGRIMFTGDPARVDEPLFTVPRQASGRALPAVLADIQAALGP